MNTDKMTNSPGGRQLADIIRSARYDRWSLSGAIAEAQVNA